MNLNLTFMISGRKEDYHQKTNVFHSVTYTKLSYDFKRLEISHTNNVAYFYVLFVLLRAHMRHLVSIIYQIIQDKNSIRSLERHEGD